MKKTEKTKVTILPEPQLKTLDPGKISLDPEALRMGELDTAYLLPAIQEAGRVIEPLSVIDGAKGKYVVLAGNTRLACALELGLESVPALHYPGELNEAQRDIIRNDFNRKGLDLYEKALFIRRLIDQGLTEKQIVSQTHELLSGDSKPTRIREKEEAMKLLQGKARQTWKADLDEERLKWLKGKLQTLKRMTQNPQARAHAYALVYGQFPSDYEGPKLDDDYIAAMTQADIKELAKAEGKPVADIHADVKARKAGKEKDAGTAQKAKARPKFPEVKSRHFLTLRAYLDGDEDVSLKRIQELDKELVELDKPKPKPKGKTTKTKSKAKAKAKKKTTKK